jgi:hypothetical protein
LLEKWERDWREREEGGRIGGKIGKKISEKRCEGKREMAIYRSPRQNAEDDVKHPEGRCSKSPLYGHSHILHKDG